MRNIFFFNRARIVISCRSDFVAVFWRDAAKRARFAILSIMIVGGLIAVNGNLVVTREITLKYLLRGGPKLLQYK